MTNFTIFLTVLERLLGKINDIGLDCVIVGDANVDWLIKSSERKSMCDVLACSNFQNFVDFPTRVSVSSATAIDHFYTNFDGRSVDVSAVKSNLSDHYGLRGSVVVRSAPGVRQPQHRLVRDNTCAARDAFQGALYSVDWDEVYSCRTNANCFAESLINIMTNNFEICFPLKRKPIRNHNNKTWVTDEIFNLKALLFDLSDLCEKFPQNSTVKEKLNDLNIHYNKRLRSERTKFMTDKISNSSNTNKTMWQIVNTEIGKCQRNVTDFTDIIKSPDGVDFPSDKCLLNYLNDQFVTAAARCGAPSADLASVSAALEVARPPADRSMRMQPFTPAEVHSIITKRLAKKPTTDVYGISVETLVAAVRPISLPLAKLFNMCVVEGIYPKPFKEVKVCPLYKGKGKRKDPNSYRPISIIPAIAKAFENGLTSRLTRFLQDTGALSDRQYAYRAGRSTTMLAREVVRSIVCARERKHQVALLCCDLSKAFDVADHVVLEAKLRYYGIDGPALALITDFMTARTQYVVGRRGDQRSDGATPDMGVPQGSSLSNLAFSLLLNDLPSVITDAEVFLYADDVAAVVTAPSLDALELQLNAVALQLARWFRQNGLVLNRTKTEFIQFDLSGRYRRPLEVGIERSRIQQVAATCFLGFQIDHSLTWESHIDKLCGKLSGACFALNRISSSPRKLCAPATTPPCNLSSVQSEFWARGADWERAFRLQKRAVRVVARVEPGVPAKEHFVALGIMTVPCLLIFQVATYVWENRAQYSCRGDNRLYQLRYGGRLQPANYSLTKSAKTAHVMGPEVFNRLPTNVTSAPNVDIFKKRLRIWLVKQSFYTYNEFKALALANI